MTVTEAARQSGVAPSTLHRWLSDGFLAGEQLTPGAPWRIRLTDELRARFIEDAPDGWLPMRAAMKALGVSRQTVLQRVKRGELRAVHVRTGRQKGLRIQGSRRRDTFRRHYHEHFGSVTMPPTRSSRRRACFSRRSST